jgi:plastocyanin
MRRYLVLAALLGVFGMALPADASPETSSTVTAENTGGFYGEEEHRWTPSQTTVSTVGGVTLSNPTEIKHGVHWIAPPSTPTCDSGVPVGTTEAASGTKWSGTCTFAQAGTYTYYCTVHGAAMSGTITVKEPGTPTAATSSPTEVAETAATLDGIVKPEGNPTSYYFKYGPTIGPEQKTPPTPASVRPDFEEHPVSAALTGLEAGTEYRVELVAIYGAVKTEVPGGELTFKTPTPPPPGPPSATTGAAAAISETGATLKGTVNPDGRSTEYHFEWGPSEAYGQATAAVPAGTDHFSHIASATLSSLTPGTLYHFRLVATNASSETAFGADQAFTTLAPKESPSKTTTTTETAPPPSTPQIGSLLVKPEPLLSGAPLPASSVKLSAPRHGSTVRGSLEVGQAGAGGRLEVDLLAKRASLSKSRGSSGSKPVRVGRLLRASVSAGKLPFSVALTAAAKRALSLRHRLVVTVKIVLTPPQGAPVTITRGVTLRS